MSYFIPSQINFTPAATNELATIKLEIDSETWADDLGRTISMATDIANFKKSLKAVCFHGNKLREPLFSLELDTAWQPLKQFSLSWSRYRLFLAN